MIKISIKTDTEKIYSGFRVEGHAGYLDEGQDIICAAVSMLVINTINSIETFTKDVFEVHTEEEIGLIELKMMSEVSDEAKLLLDSLFLGFRVIKEEYGNDFIEIIN
jgi:uncharacterized protein